MSVNVESLKQAGSHEELEQSFDIKKESEFIQACITADLKKVTELLAQNSALVNIPDTRGCSPLIVTLGLPTPLFPAWETLTTLARNEGRGAIVTKLLEHGAEVDAQFNPKKPDEHTGITALWLAVCRGAYDIAERLLKAGAKNLDAVPAGGREKGLPALWQVASTAAFNSRWLDAKPLIKALLEAGAKNLDAIPTLPAEGSDELDEFYENEGLDHTALLMAAEGSEWEVVEMLLDAGVKKLDDGEDDSGKTVLYLAVEDEQERVFRLLLNKGASLQFSDDSESIMTLGNLKKLIYGDGNSLLGRPTLASSFTAALAIFSFAQKTRLTNEEICQLDQSLAILCQRPYLALNGRVNGETALHLAIKNDNKIVIEKLVLAGADLLLPNNEDETAQSLLFSSALVQGFAKLQKLRGELDKWLALDKPKEVEGKESKERKEQVEHYIKGTKEQVEMLLKEGQKLEPLHKDAFYYQLGELLHEKREQGLMSIPAEVTLETFSRVLNKEGETYQKACTRRFFYERVIEPSPKGSGLEEEDPEAEGEISRAVMAVSAGSEISGEDLYQPIVRAVLGREAGGKEFPSMARGGRSESVLTRELALERAFELLRQEFSRQRIASTTSSTSSASLTSSAASSLSASGVGPVIFSGDLSMRKASNSNKRQMRGEEDSAESNKRRVKPE